MPIIYERKNPIRQNEGPFYAMLPLETRWGNISLSTRITDANDFQTKFGLYMSSTEHSYSTENQWMQGWNFLQYSQNLKIFRFASETCTPSFNLSDNLTSVSGSGHAHIFVNDTSHANITSVWNQGDNGSDIYFRKNDLSPEEGVPEFATNQLLFVAGKYAGILGNDIQISIANSDSDLTSTYAFKWDYIEVADASSFSVDDTITGDTSGASATVKQIIGDTIYYDLNTTTDFTTETINTATTTITAVNSGDDVDVNYSFSEIFDRNPESDEFAIVVSLDGKVIESGIFSFNIEKENFCEDSELKYVIFKCDRDWTSAKVSEICGEYLEFGKNDALTDSQMADQVYAMKRQSLDRVIIVFLDATASQPLNAVKYAFDQMKQQIQMLVFSTQEI